MYQVLQRMIGVLMISMRMVSVFLKRLSVLRIDPTISEVKREVVSAQKAGGIGSSRRAQWRESGSSEREPARAPGMPQPTSLKPDRNNRSAVSTGFRFPRKTLTLLPSLFDHAGDS